MRNHPGVFISPYSSKYKKEVINLILGIWEGEFNYRNIKRPDIYDITNAYQKDKESNFWVAILDKRLVGTIGLQKHSENTGYIRRMAVAKNMRRKGIGEKLLETLIQFAQKSGYKELCAGLVKENTIAIKFYKKHGFKKYKIPKDLKQLGEEICLKLDLD